MHSASRRQLLGTVCGAGHQAPQWAVIRHCMASAQNQAGVQLVRAATRCRKRRNGAVGSTPPWNASAHGREQFAMYSRRRLQRCGLPRTQKEGGGIYAFWNASAHGCAQFAGGINAPLECECAWLCPICNVFHKTPPGII